MGFLQEKCVRLVYRMTSDDLIQMRFITHDPPKPALERYGLRFQANVEHLQLGEFLFGILV